MGECVSVGLFCYSRIDVVGVDGDDNNNDDSIARVVVVLAAVSPFSMFFGFLTTPFIYFPSDGLI